MKPTNLSASSGAVYEDCPARYQAEFIDRARMPTGDPAGIGIVCHSVLERFVNLSLWNHPGTIDQVKAIYDKEYYTVFSDKRHYNEGLKLVQAWWPRQDWSGRTVVSTEKRDSFKLSTSAGDLPFVYIIDRLDVLEDGAVEVVDYKTVSQPIQPEDLKHKLQARAYAVAAQLMYPDADRIWVTFDLLRFNSTVSCCFTKEENRDNYRYLRNLAERILHDDRPREILNPDCRWCVRKSVCSELYKHVAARGPLSHTDVDVAALQRYELDLAQRALSGLVNELDEFILSHMAHEELLMLKVPGLQIEVDADKRRNIDSYMAAQVIPDAIMRRYGQLRMGDVDDLLKGDDLTDKEKEELQKLISTKVGKAKLKFKKKP